MIIKIIKSGTCDDPDRPVFACKDLRQSSAISHMMGTEDTVWSLNQMQDLAMACRQQGHYMSCGPNGLFTIVTKGTYERYPLLASPERTLLCRLLAAMLPGSEPERKALLEYLGELEDHLDDDGSVRDGDLWALSMDDEMLAEYADLIRRQVRGPMERILQERNHEQ